MKISVVIDYCSGSTDAIEKTIEACRLIVSVSEIIIFYNRDIKIYSKKQLPRKVKFFDASNRLDIINNCEDWIAFVDKDTVVDTKFFLPFIAIPQNKKVIYFPEVEYPYSYSNLLGTDINLEYIDSDNDSNVDVLITCGTFISNKEEWLKCSDGNGNADKVISCIVNGMVLKVINGMVCKGKQRSIKPFLHERHIRRTQIPFYVIEEENWNADNDKSKIF